MRMASRFIMKRRILIGSLCSQNFWNKIQNINFLEYCTQNKINFSHTEYHFSATRQCHCTFLTFLYKYHNDNRIGVNNRKKNSQTQIHLFGSVHKKTLGQYVFNKEPTFYMCIFLLVTIQSKIFHLRRIRQVVHNPIQQWLRNRKYSNQYVCSTHVDWCGATFLPGTLNT